MPPMSLPDSRVGASLRELRAAGVVLAAGAGRRMGRNKMLLTLQGETLVRRAVRTAMEGGLDPVVVVTGDRADEVRHELADLPCETVFNPDFEGPTSGSLHRALERLPADVEGAVILLGDMVFAVPEVVRTLVEAAAAGSAPIIASRYGEVVAPPLLFRRELFPELLAWHGEGCGKAVVRAHFDEVTFIDRPLEALADVDTPEDFERARAAIE